MNHSRHFDDRLASVPNARHFVTHVLDGQVAGETREMVELMVSELATNCIRHARSAFSVRIEVNSARVRVQVSDTGPGEPSVRSSDVSEPSGRGLRVVQDLSDAWGVVSNQTGKTVWFVVRLEERPGAHEDAETSGASESTSPRLRGHATPVDRTRVESLAA